MSQWVTPGHCFKKIVVTLECMAVIATMVIIRLALLISADLACCLREV